MINFTTNRHDENLVSSSSDVVNSPTYHICDTNNNDLVSSSIDARDSEGETPLHYAIYSEYAINIFNCALTSNYYRVDFHVSDDVIGRNYLHHAIELGNVQLTEYIAHHCPDLTSDQDNLGDIPIHTTIFCNNIVIFRLLLNTFTPEELKNIIDMEGFLGFTALHYAAQNGSLEMTNELLQRGVNPNSRNLCSSTPLHIAVESNNMALVGTLCRNGANLNLQDHLDRIPLDYASTSEMRNLLLLHSGLMENIQINQYYNNQHAR